VQKSGANDRLLDGATSCWRGHEGLKWVDSRGSIRVPRMPAVDASSPFRSADTSGGSPSPHRTFKATRPFFWLGLRSGWSRAWPSLPFG